MINLDYRQVSKEDYGELEEIIIDTWNYRNFCEKEITAKRLGKIFLYSCLLKQSFSSVVLIDGKVSGVIMARNCKEKDGLKPLLSIRLMYQYLRLCLTKDGKKTMKIFTNYEQINKELYASSKKNYEGEIVFFVLDKNCRGKGIGKQLFMKAQQYFSENQIRSFYLYTDCSCNYQFYEHIGMHRCCYKEYDMRPKFMQSFTFFLYEFNFKK